MKKLLLLIVVIALVAVVFFQYKAYKRFNPPSDYNYVLSDSIDVNYYDQVVVQQYYDNAYELGQFARSTWANRGIDVLFPSDDIESIEASKYYTSKTSLTKRLEDKLKYSASLKDMGYDNRAIEYIMKNGISPEHHYYITNQNFIGLKLGDKNHEVWEVQKALIAFGYEIPNDGVFGLETESALQLFQEKNDLYPSGIVDEKTIKKIIK